MQVIEAHYDIVTPMFIGGGEVQDSPELRPPSIKGALRFWWRALQWGACLNQNNQDTDLALKDLHHQEAVLFGAAAKDDKFGQGFCRLKLKEVKPKGEEQNWPKNNEGGAGFLGFGLDATQGGAPHRKAINQGEFTVCLMLKPDINKEQISQLKNTLILWGLLGGLGSRARRGFGSVAIKQLDEQHFKFSDQDAYHDAIRNLLNVTTLAPSMPIFTAVNNSMQIAQAGQHKDPRRLMDELGAQYKMARQDAGKGRAKAPFGLPLAGNRGVADDNRRGSPLLMHIHPVAAEFVALVTFMPANFHPDYSDGNHLDFYRALQNYMNKETMAGVYP